MNNPISSKDNENQIRNRKLFQNYINYVLRSKKLIQNYNKICLEDFDKIENLIKAISICANSLIS